MFVGAMALATISACGTTDVTNIYEVASDSGVDARVDAGGGLTMDPQDGPVDTAANADADAAWGAPDVGVDVSVEAFADAILDSLVEAAAYPCSQFNGGTGCPTGQICVDDGAACCPSADDYCAGFGGCIDVHASDPGHCGSCDMVCPASEVCSAGQCVLYDGSVGPSQCNTPTEVGGGFEPPDACPDQNGENYCDPAATLSGCVVTAASPRGAFGLIGTNVRECSGNPDEYPCCLAMETIVGIECYCYSCP